MNSLRNLLAPAMLFVLVFSLSSCDVIGGIFKAGAYTGIIIAVLVLVLVLWLVRRFRR